MEATIRVALLTSDDIFLPGGVERSIQRIAAGLRRFGGCEADVLMIDLETTTENRVEEIRHAGDFAVYRLTASPLAMSQRDRSGDIHRTLVALQRDRGYSLMHAFYASSVGFLTTYTSTMCDIPSVVSLRGNDINRDIFAADRVGHLALSIARADAVTAVSEELRRKALWLSGRRDDIRVIHNSVDDRVFDATPAERSASSPRIGTAGVFKFKKGIDTLLRAFTIVRDRQPHATLTLIGDFIGSERAAFHERLDRHPHRAAIHVTGFLPHHSIAACLRELDVFAFPSLQDGCPNVVLEAMATGCTIVATRVGAVPELLTDGVSALLVPPGDVPAFAGALLEALSPRASQLGERAREAARRLAPEREIQEFLEVYAHVLSGVAHAVPHP